MTIGSPRFTRQFHTQPLRQKLQQKVVERVARFHEAREQQNKGDIQTHTDPFSTYLQMGENGDVDRIVFEWMLYRDVKQTFIYTYSFTIGDLRSANLNEVADTIIDKVIECLDDFE